jgi:two-component system NtrC family sensor kinase
MNEVKYILEQIRKTKTTVLIIILLAFILFYYKSLVTQVVVKKIETVDEVKKDINNNVLIQQMLNELMLKYNADRAYIFQFHNTIKYYDGTHRNHQSMTFEVCANGISSEANNLQNIPVSLHPMFLQNIMLNKMNYCDIHDIEEHSTKLSLLNQGIQSIVIAPYFKDGSFVAYIGLDFVKDKQKEEIDFQKFKQFTNEIGKILML